MEKFICESVRYIPFTSRNDVSILSYQRIWWGRQRKYTWRALNCLKEG